MKSLSILLFGASQLALAVPMDVSGVRPGPVTVTSSTTSATVRWVDEANRTWTAEFSLEPRAPLRTRPRQTT